VGGGISYEGEFKDDKKCGHCEVLDLGIQHGKYKGMLSENEELTGGRLDFPNYMKLRYEGGFKENLFHGQGKLTYLDTGNVFEGEFYQHHKDGPCTFTLAQTGQVYKGTFEFNYESATEKCDYGPRK
jgi:hypothetical protein